MSSVLYKPVRYLGPAGRSRAGGRPRPVGFDVTDWFGGGAADDAGFGIVELDRQCGVGDGNADGLPGVGAAEGGGAALHAHRFRGWPWWWAGGTGAAQPGNLGGGERVGPGAQQYPGGGV